ncbi:tetratricopeptide repeat protein [uncultured Winogradskyella sp.]|uniref:tetratricopeptide repeat protein n=1 Tax=uncultured Winogradskyella sp. TaxID=395353 RepID=UPI00262FFB83|nr:tetratricopeptide repeat protein [uncultured Winogradskyella sp.]
MKKLITLVLVFAVATMSFAQKNEIKAIEKALKSKNFSDAKSAVSSAEALIGNMDDKTKAKFYFLKAQALYANGAGTDANIDKAIVALDKLKDLESSMGKLKYTDQANEMKNGMFKSFLQKANQAITNKDYKTAAYRFDKMYKMSPKDTVYLYYAASSAVNANDYETSLNYYNQLKNLGYTGIKMNYMATNLESGEEEVFADKTNRDFAVRTLKTHDSPKDEKSTSKKAEIVKNIALIYVSQGEDEKALAAMSDARKVNPDDLGLLLSEANVYLKLGNMDKFKVLMEEAVSKDPNNAELLFNLGVLSSDAGNMAEAKDYYEKALVIDPNYVDVYNNLAFVTLAEESSIIEEMNNLGNSSADNKRYDELKEKRLQLYKDAIPYLEKSLSLVEKVSTVTSLINIYSVIGDMEKVNTLKAKKAQLEASSGGN